MSHFFISYSRKDSAFVNRLVNDLRDLGQSIWIDTTGIESGTNWEHAIEDAIKTSDKFLIICSPNAANSEVVKKEITFAHQNKIEIVPILLEGKFNQMPADLKLPALHGHDFRSSYRQGFQNLQENLYHGRPPADLKSLLGDSRKTFEDVAPLWDKQAIILESSNLIGLPIPIQSAYCKAYLVGRRQETLDWPKMLQVALQFTGSKDDRLIKMVAKYLYATNMPMWTVLVRGPMDEKGEKFDLPDDQPDIWTDCIESVWAAIKQASEIDVSLHFFGQAPVPIALGVGAKEHLKVTIHIYNLNRDRENAPDNKLYFRVFSFSPR